MRFFKKFIALWLVTAVIFYLGTLLFGNYLVFGNVRTNFLQAILTSSLIVGFVSAVVSEYSNKHNLPMTVWLLIYWALISLTIYAVARTPVSEWVGIGIAAFWVAFILGVVVHLGHHHTHKRLKTR